MVLWPERLPSRPSTPLQLPPTVKPDGPGYFSLYLAAQWIATQGGIRDFSPTDIPIWDAAFQELNARIASGEISVTGIRNGIRQKIEGHIFASLRVDHPFLDTPLNLILSEELYLCSYPYVDEEYWQKALMTAFKRVREFSGRN
jgi:hypothetical protein